MDRKPRKVPPQGCGGGGFGGGGGGSVVVVVVVVVVNSWGTAPHDFAEKKVP